jgi:hypothetical protein
MKRSFLLLFLLAGCQAPGFFVKETPVTLREAQTNVVSVLRTNYVGTTVYLTNFVTVPGSTDVQPVVTASVKQTPVVSTNLEARILPAIVVTNLAVGDGIAGAATAVGGVAPVPWGGAAAQTLLAVAGAAFGVVNHFRAKKALKAAAIAEGDTAVAQDSADTFAKTAQVLIANVDHIREAAKGLPGYTPAWDDKVMSVLQTAQVLSGTKATIGSMVDQHAADMRQVG